MKRRSIRLPGRDYDAGDFFVTFCTHDRECLLGEVRDGNMVLNAAGEVVERALVGLPNRFLNVRVDAFVVMPNHVHALLAVREGKIELTDAVAGPSDGAIRELPLHAGPEVDDRDPTTDNPYVRRRMTLPKAVGFLKMTTAKVVNEQRGTRGVPLWQRNYFEQVVREHDDLERLLAYIRSNPERWDSDEENPSRRG